MPNMPQRNIYVREEDRELWEWVQAYARAHRMTVSAVVMTAIERLRAEREQDNSSRASSDPS